VLSNLAVCHIFLKAANNIPSVVCGFFF